MASSPLDLLRPKPFRGDVVAAGAVVLATLVWTVRVSFSATWGAGVHLACAVVACAFVVAMAVLSPMEGETPRAYQSVLYVASVALFIDVAVQVVRVLDADSTGAATVAIAAVAVFALAFATRRNSAICTLLGALAGGLSVLVAVFWIFSSADISTFRWVLVVLMVLFGIAAVGQRDRRPRHGVALIDAAGVAALAIAASFEAAETFGGLVDESGDPRPAISVAWGWELLALAVGFGLIAYSSVDRQPGPAYLGVLNLIVFVINVALGDGGPTLLGWPLVLALAAAFLLVIGLRPTTPAPPAPDVDAPEPPPLPLR